MLKKSSVNVRLDAFRHVRYFFLLKRSSVECISDFFFPVNAYSVHGHGGAFRGREKKKFKLP